MKWVEDLDGDGRLKLAWSHGWTDVITTEKRALRPISNGVVAVAVDGQSEIIASVADGNVYLLDAK